MLISLLVYLDTTLLLKGL